MGCVARCWLASAAALVAVAACSDPSSPARPPDSAVEVPAAEVGEVGPRPSRPPRTTPPVTVGEPPDLVVPSAVAVELDLAGGGPGSGELAVRATDPDGGSVVVVVTGPSDLTVDSPGTWMWRPTEPTTASATVIATDDTGLATQAVVELRARYPRRDGALVGLGDSVASGQGLDLLDYLGRDDCFRAETDAYPRFVFEALVQGGRLDAATAEFALVACGGARLDDLVSEPVGGGLEGTARSDADELSQLEWAVRANPAVVTLTIGANDLGFVDPERLIGADGMLLQSEVDSRLGELGHALTDVLDTLTAQTDATIAITNYYNPAAASPQGVAGCTTACFFDASELAVGQMNDTIEQAASRFGDRVVVADLRVPFADHRAPNGLGPDGARAGLGPLGGVIGPLFQGSHPYCARGQSPGETWISSLDCVHPNEEGARQIATAVLVALGG